MANMLDYLDWRGDVPFSADPFNEADALVLAELGYVPLEHVVPESFSVRIRLAEAEHRFDQEAVGDFDRIYSFETDCELLHRMAQSVRFRNTQLTGYLSRTDHEELLQFSAMTCLVPDGPTVVCFRGTDHTLVGWKEDFMMSYISPVPAQEASLDYLTRIAALTEGPLVLTGHSKGGNLAFYAAAKAEKAVQNRLVMACSFDGPGLDDETIASEGYAAIRPVLHAVIPNGSVVGLLMNYHPDYTVVTSTTVGLAQHDAYTWEILGGSFHEADETTFSSQLMNETVHTWLATSPQSQVQHFVEVLFTALEKLYPHRGAEDLKDIQLINMTEAAAYVVSLDPESRNMLSSLLMNLFNIGKENYLQLLMRRPLDFNLGDLENMLRGLQLPTHNESDKQETDPYAD